MDPEFLATFEALRKHTKCSVDSAVVAASLLFVADSVETMTAVMSGQDATNEDLREVVADSTEPAPALTPTPTPGPATETDTGAPVLS